MTMTKQKKALYRIITVGLMAALVFAGNYLQIKIPNGVLVTRIHLGNSMCLLAGLLFGGVSGGLASGIGAGLYDLFDPVYIVSAPYTFISKFAMGFTAGLLRKTNEKKRVILSAIAGQAVYIVLYLLKSYVTIIILGGTSQAAWAAVGTNAITSTVNGVLAVVIAVPLYFLLRTALKQTTIYQLIAENDIDKDAPKEKKGYFNPLTVILTIFAIVTTLIFTIDLAATNKVKAKEAEKEQQYIDRIDELENQITYLYDRLGVEMPVTEETEEEAT